MRISDWSSDVCSSDLTVLPARLPNLLVNGAGGIAVGMATNIPPHNLGEVIDATLATIDNPAITLDELMAIVPGPDFPTGATMLGQGGARLAYATGRGSIMMRPTYIIEEGRGDRQSIVLTAIRSEEHSSELQSLMRKPYPVFCLQQKK